MAKVWLIETVELIERAGEYIRHITIRTSFQRIGVPDIAKVCQGSRTHSLMKSGNV